MTEVNCHPELCKANQRGTSCVSLHPSAKPLGVSGSCSRDDVTQPRPRISKFAKLTKKFNPRRGGVHPVSEAHRNHNPHYTHLTHFTHAKRAAFTLAEVLITLGIIGVVAAMTIPTLIANYKQKTLDNQFKKTYSMISQVLLRVKGDFGYTPQCYNINAAGYKRAECKEFKEKFLEKLKVSRICETKGFENGCIPEYNGVDTVLKNEHKDDENYDEDYWQDYASRNCGGFTQSQILNNRKVYVLADGTILFFYNSEQDADSIPVFAMDINGITGPNKWGHDLFGFMISIDGNNNLQVAASGCMRAEDGGLYTADMIDKLFH